MCNEKSIVSSMQNILVCITLTSARMAHKKVIIAVENIAGFVKTICLFKTYTCMFRCMITYVLMVNSKDKEHPLKVDVFIDYLHMQEDCNLAENTSPRHHESGSKEWIVLPSKKW